MQRHLVQQKGMTQQKTKPITAKSKERKKCRGKGVRGHPVQQKGMMQQG